MAAEIIKSWLMSGYVKAYFIWDYTSRMDSHFQQNYDAARYFYEMGATANDSLSMMNLGVFYDKGLGVEVDNEKALHWHIQGRRKRR